jgi:SOS-response transcriptional repressor LexA
MVMAEGDVAMAKRIGDASEARENLRPRPAPETAPTSQGLRQAGLQDIIRDFRDEWGEAPTVRDLCRILGIDRSPDVEDHLRALEKRGLLRRAPGDPDRSS